MKKYSQKVIQAVVGQIINMYDNNVLNDYGNETFEGWCEDGEVFMDLEYKDQCIELMKQLSPQVDKLTGIIEDSTNYNAFWHSFCNI